MELKQISSLATRISNEKKVLNIFKEIEPHKPFSSILMYFEKENHKYYSFNTKLHVLYLILE